MDKSRNGNAWIFRKVDINKEPHQLTLTGFLKIGHRPTLPRFTAVPSALAGLTSLFGMGRGRHRRYRHLNVFSSLVHLLIS